MCNTFNRFLLHVNQALSCTNCNSYSVCRDVYGSLKVLRRRDVMAVDKYVMTFLEEELYCLYFSFVSSILLFFSVLFFLNCCSVLSVLLFCSISIAVLFYPNCFVSSQLFILLSLLLFCSICMTVLCHLYCYFLLPLLLFSTSVLLPQGHVTKFLTMVVDLQF